MKKTFCRSAGTTGICFGCSFLNVEVKTQAVNNEYGGGYVFKEFLEEAAGLLEICDWRYVTIYLGESFDVTIDIIFVFIIFFLLFIMVMRRVL